MVFVQLDHCHWMNGFAAHHCHRWNGQWFLEKWNDGQQWFWKSACAKKCESQQNNNASRDKFTRYKALCYWGVSSKLISDQQCPILVSLFWDILPLLIIRLLILTKPDTLALWLLPLWKINGFQGHHCHWMNGLESIHWNQWNGNGFLVWQPLVPMEWRWFSMVCNHWSNNGMVTIHRCGLLQTHLTESKPCVCKSKLIFTRQHNQALWFVDFPSSTFCVLILFPHCV